MFYLVPKFDKTSLTFHVEWQDCMWLCVCIDVCIFCFIDVIETLRSILKSIINILKRSLNQKENTSFYRPMCFTSLCIYSQFVYSKFAIYLFCFYEMLKKVEREYFVFLFDGTFLSDGIVLCLCRAQAVYYSSFTMLCIWLVGCVLRELYSQSALQMSKPPSELWYKCLVQYVLLFNEKKETKRGGGGGWKWEEEL